MPCSSRCLPAAALRLQHFRRVGHDAPEHVPEQGAAGKLPGCTAAVERQDQVGLYENFMNCLGAD